jgi:hypothetical protein
VIDTVSVPDGTEVARQRDDSCTHLMPVRRIPIVVSDKVASRIETAAGPTPVSIWVRDLVHARLDDVALERQWLEFYRDVAPKHEDVRRAEGMLERLTMQRPH